MIRTLILGGLLAAVSAAHCAHALTLEITPAAQTRSVGQSLAYDAWVRRKSAEGNRRKSGSDSSFPAA